jgi:hypothetical protein
MVAIGISEFTFGFAFLYEQTTANWPDLTAAPVLPSLQQEQNAGWDALLPVEGTPYFYQFKLTEYLYRGNATFIRDGIYNSPYYRISLHRRDNNRQHRLLRTHSLQNPETYYVAPEIDTIGQFNNLFLARNLTNNSRLIPLSDCDDISETDEIQHYITFTQSNQNWIFHSDPSRKEHSYFGADISNLYRSTRDTWKPLDTRFTKDLLERTIEIVREVSDLETIPDLIADRRLLEDGILGSPRQQLLQRIADIVAAVFGVTMVMVGTPQKP